MTIAFIFAIVALYIKDKESGGTAKRVSEFHTRRSQLYVEKSKPKAEKQEISQLKDILGKEGRAVEESSSELQAKQQEIEQLKNILSNKDKASQRRLSKLQVKKQETDPLKEAIPGIILWIEDKETGKVVFMQGSLNGVKKGSIYNVYHGKKIVGQFRVDDALEYISFGQIVNYNKEKFPKNVNNLRARCN